MTFEMILVVAILLLAVLLFATEKLPVDLVAIIVMSILLVTEIITPEEGIAGFSNTATITIGAMFVISAGLRCCHPSPLPLRLHLELIPGLSSLP